MMKFIFGVIVGFVISNVGIAGTIEYLDSGINESKQVVQSVWDSVITVTELPPVEKQPEE